MPVKTIIKDDPRSFFYYRGDFYIDGTEIALKDEYINTHKWNGQKIWKYARFVRQCNYNGRVSYYFAICGTGWFARQKLGLEDTYEHIIRKEHSYYFILDAFELESAIEDIPKPFKLERAQTEAVLDAIVTPKKDTDYPEVVMAWIVYIFLLIGSLIFKQFYLLWAIETFIFLKIRKDMMGL